MNIWDFLAHIHPIALCFIILCPCVAVASFKGFGFVVTHDDSTTNDYRYHRYHSNWKKTGTTEPEGDEDDT